MSQRSLVVKIVLLAALYFGFAKLGIELSVAHGVITPVWAPTGLSLAALLLFGYRLWPGVALGALVANATSDLPVGLAAAIAVGNTLEAVVGTYLLRRVGFDNSLERVRDVLALVMLGAFVGTVVSATNGVGTLWLGNQLETSDLSSEWVLWWFGDAIGALLVTPALLAWLSPRRTRLSGHSIEAALLAAAVAGASAFVFIGGNWKYPYLLFPFLVWAAIRFKQVGATSAVLIVGVIGTIGTVQGAVPIGGATETESVQILQALIAVVGVAIFIIAATIAERDVARTESWQAEQELSDAFRRERESGDQLRELDQIKNTFMSAVSHDLRTPLTVIVGLADALVKRLDELKRDEVREILSHMNTSAVRASHVLQNLLDVDRVSSGTIVPAMSDVDLGDLAARVARDLEPREQPRVEVPPGQVIARVDEGLVERILDNLLLNAVRHTPKDTPIWVRVVEQDSGVALWVEDSGQGVPDALKETVFEPFQRGPGSSAVGSGVGLYLVARFAELHGGRAWVEDRPGGGASFRVFFPNKDEGAANPLLKERL